MCRCVCWCVLGVYVNVRVCVGVYQSCLIHVRFTLLMTSLCLTNASTRELRAAGEGKGRPENRTRFTLLNTPYTALNTPYTVPNTPLTALNTPVTVSNTPVTVLNTPFTLLNTPFTVSNTPLAVLNTPFTVLNTLVTGSNTPVTVSNTPVAVINTPTGTLLLLGSEAVEVHQMLSSLRKIENNLRYYDKMHWYIYYSVCVLPASLSESSQSARNYQQQQQ